MRAVWVNMFHHFYYDRVIETTDLFSLFALSDCYGRIWKLTVFTVFTVF